MRKKIISILLVTIMTLSLSACGMKSDVELMSAATRPYSEADAEILYLDSEAIALAQSVTIDDIEASENMRAQARAALDKCNENRSVSGLSTLKWNEGLEQAAMVRAQEIVGTWSHTRPNGTEWWTVNSALMYGENLAKGYSSSDAAVDAWMNSPSHKENIMDGEFKTCGIAIYEVGGVWYWAEEFGF